MNSSTDSSAVTSSIASFEAAFEKEKAANDVNAQNGRYLAQALAAQKISIRGARTHNLKNIDIDIPRNQLMVITGLSGSGKSSLAFDTLAADGEGRNRGGIEKTGKNRIKTTKATE